MRSKKRRSSPPPWHPDRRGLDHGTLRPHGRPHPPPPRTRLRLRQAAKQGPRPPLGRRGSALLRRRLPAEKGDEPRARRRRRPPLRRRGQARSRDRRRRLRRPRRWQFRTGRTGAHRLRVRSAPRAARGDVPSWVHDVPNLRPRSQRLGRCDRTRPPRRAWVALERARQRMGLRSRDPREGASARGDEQRSTNVRRAPRADRQRALRRETERARETRGRFEAASTHREIPALRHLRSARRSGRAAQHVDHAELGRVHHGRRCLGREPQGQRRSTVRRGAPVRRLARRAGRRLAARDGVVRGAEAAHGRVRRRRRARRSGSWQGDV